EVLVHYEAGPSAGTGRVEVGSDSIQKTGLDSLGLGSRARGMGGSSEFVERVLICVQIEEANAAEQQDRGPDPAAMEIGHELEEIAQAETDQQDRQEICAGAEHKERGITEPGADRPDPVLNGPVGVGGVDREVVAMIGK